MQLLKRGFLFYCHLSKRAERGEEWLGYLPSDDVQREKEITCRNERVFWNLRATRYDGVGQSLLPHRRRPNFVYRPVVRPKRRDDASRVIETSFSFFLLFLPCCNTQLFFVFIWSRQSSSAPPNRCVYDRAHSSISSALLFRSVLLTYDPLFFKKR
jgi:hypothetical protein